MYTRLSIPAPSGTLSALNFGRGSGPVDLLFLHATGFNALTYRQLLEGLDPGLRILALDQRGHGRTRLPADPGRLTGWGPMADDVIEVVDGLNQGQPLGLIAGHSMGGTVAMLSVARQSTLARSLLLIDPAFVPPQFQRWFRVPGVPRLLRRRLPLARGAARRRADFPDRDAAVASYRGRGAFRTWAPGFLEDYVEDGFLEHPSDEGVTLSCRPAWESAVFAAHRHPLAVPTLARLAVPTHLLLAERHSVAAPLAPLIREQAPQVRIETVAGSTHFIPMEHAGLVAGRMLELLHRG